MTPPFSVQAHGLYLDRNAPTDDPDGRLTGDLDEQSGLDDPVSAVAGSLAIAMAVRGVRKEPGRNDAAGAKTYDWLQSVSEIELRPN
jgi:hypothetical protein